MTCGTPTRRVLPWLALGLLVAGAACSKKGEAASTEVPAADAAAPGSSGESLESLEADLGRLTGELAIVEAAQSPDAGADAMGNAAGKCERLCGIKVSICELSASICGLADEHPDESRYVESCGSAREHCEHATAVCEERGCDACPS